MKLNPQDRRRLYAIGSFALVLTGLGAASVWWSLNESRQVQNSLKQAEERASEIQKRLRQVNIEEQEIRAKSAVFRQLEARRIVGPEQRLDWIELVDAIREQNRLFDINYEISAQKGDGAPLGDFSFKQSEMRFQLPLLHEGDLLGFLTQLQARAPALIHVRQCELTRADGRQPGDPNLDARCRVEWTTIAQGKSGGRS
jgi:hypothetical protein